HFKNNLIKAFDMYDINLDAAHMLDLIKEENHIEPKDLQSDINPYIKQKVNLPMIDKILSFVQKEAQRETEKDTYQAMQSLMHNLNTMHSRAGAQVPFSSLNYGTDTSHEGRLVIESILKATQAGLGQGETPIFPIQIFKLKKGVRLEKGDPN